MNKTQILLEENSFLNYCYLNIVFCDFLLNSKNILEKISSNESIKLKDIFIEKNEPNKNNYLKQKLMIINNDSKTKKLKISIIKSKIGFDFNNIKEKEEEIIGEIRVKIIEKIKEIMKLNKN